MSSTRQTRTILVPSVEEVPRLSEAERAALLVSLEAARADIEAGDHDVLGPDTLRREFEAILENDLTDEELDVLLGITPRPPG